MGVRMRGLFVATALAVMALAASGCQSKKDASAQKTAFAPERAGAAIGGGGLVSSGSLAGRTITVSSIGDIRLNRGEVVLTFDDGPIPGRTDAVLSVLRTYGVRATFLMVGSQARANPGTARKVAAGGHTIGSHTERHANLARMSLEQARAEINAGQKSVAAALIPTGYRPAPFFRFPYLADTAALRSALANQGVVVMDVNIDSKDYFPSSSAQVKSRTMQRVLSRGSGIVLFHDIHTRTAQALPAFLDELKANGFKVVHLVPGRSAGDTLVSTFTDPAPSRAYAYTIPEGITLDGR